MTKAKALPENAGVAFQGMKLTGPFDIPGDEAAVLLGEPLNVNSRPNSDVVKRLYDVEDVVGRDSDRWVVDYGTGHSRAEAALYEAPFALVAARVLPFREDPEQCRSTEPRLLQRFWEFQRPRPHLREAVRTLERFIVTPESSEHRVFVFVPAQTLIQGSLFAIARSDFLTFGILSSKIHEVWATAQGNRLGVGNQRRYNIGVTFETFPFPAGMAPTTAAAEAMLRPEASTIARIAARLNELRVRWLYPPELVKADERIASRLIPVDAAAERILRLRTMTSLYNQRPQWLQDVHTELDAAVATAYGWPANIDEADILGRLLEMNLGKLRA